MTDIVTSGLQLYLNSKQGVSGTTWADLSGNGNNATLYGSPTVASNGMTFDGTGNQYAAFPVPSMFQNSNQPYTLGFRVLPTTLASGTYPDLLVDVNGATSDSHFDVWLYPDNSNALEYGWNAELSYLNLIYAGNPYWVAVVYNGTTYTLYINGSTAHSSTPSPAPVPLGKTGLLYITTALNPLDGVMDNIVLYGRALSAAEISQNYSVGTAIGLPSGNISWTYTPPVQRVYAGNDISAPAVDASNSALGYRYTTARVDAALHASSRTELFRYELLDKDNKVKKQLTTVTACSVTYDYTQQVKRTMSLTLRDDPDINYLSDRIRPYVLVGMPDGGYAQYPAGLFLLSTPPRQTDSALVVTRQVTGYDLGQILLDTLTTDRLTIAAGANYITEVGALLSDAGIADANLTATSLTLPVALDYAGGTPYLTIINDLLTAINYKTLWFNAAGQAVAQPWADPSTRAPMYTYVDDSESVTLPTVSDSYDLFSVPNQWVVVVAQTTTAELVSTYTNTRADSPTSTVNRGRTITHYEQNLNAPLSETLDSFAQRLAFTDSQVYDTVTYSTAIMPFHEDLDTVRFHFSALGIRSNFSEQGWSFSMSPGATMSHTVRKIVPV